MLSDLSVFHRIDEEEIDELTARQFWPRVRRLMHYDGAVRGAALMEARREYENRQESPEVRSSDVEEPTDAEIRAMRDAARRKRFPEAQYGKVSYVTDQEIVRKAGTSA